MARILIADDNPMVARLVAAKLKGQGYEVDVVTDGTQAMELALRSPPDLCILDVMMPGMDGYQVMEAVRAMPDFAALPIIAVTAKAMAGDRERAIAYGASDYITKPVDVEQLLSLMGIWLYPAIGGGPSSEAA